MSSMPLNKSSDFLISDTIFINSRMFIRFLKNRFQFSVEIHISICILEPELYFLEHILMLVILKSVSGNLVIGVPVDLFMLSEFFLLVFVRIIVSPCLSAYF